MHNSKLRLFWSQTKDYFDVVPDNLEFVAWFVNQCNKSESVFGVNNSAIEKAKLIDSNIQEIKNNLQKVNLFLNNLKLPIIPEPDNLYDQKNLNALHKNWIKLLRMNPRLDSLFYYHNLELFEQFTNINLLVHTIEKSFVYRFAGLPHWRIPNEFKHNPPKSGIYTVSVNYTDWGKSSWHKFVDGVTEIDDFELSNWETIGSDITLDLNVPYKFSTPDDYIKYCNGAQVELSLMGGWALGNIADINDMSRARTLVNKNLQIPNNNLKFLIV
jgi:hypothetical protein